MQENIDYELIPTEDDDHWNIRIKQGDFIESVIRFGSLKMSEDDYLHFDYDLIYSPIEDLKEDSQELQEVVKEILVSILESAMGKFSELEQG